MSISIILVLFLTQLAVGMMITITFIPSRIVDRRFYRTIAFWAFLLTLTALILGHKASLLFQLFLAACLFLWLWFRIRDQGVAAPLLWPAALLGLLAVVANSFAFVPLTGPVWIHRILTPLNFVSSSLILGGFLSGMIFGHWYLVNTEMPKRLLVTMAWILIGVLTLRILVVGTTLGLFAGFVYPDQNFLSSMISFKGHGIFFWQRVLVGLVIPAGVTAMVWNTTRIGSNQSATGIIYVGIAFVFIGELCARYLFLMTGIPL